jgi:hypothetical protein
MVTCTHPDCDLYPHYGVAPHECFYKKGPNHKIGQSTLLDRTAWPDNFVLDLEPGEDPATVSYPSACGIYYCPACKTGMYASAEGVRAQVEGEGSREALNPSRAALQKGGE